MNPVEYPCSVKVGAAIKYNSIILECLVCLIYMGNRTDDDRFYIFQPLYF